MKKKLLFIGLCLSCIVSIHSLKASGEETNPKKNMNVSSISAKQFASGKWVAMYEGGKVPSKCVCVKSLLDTDCAVGDVSRNLSLCE